MDKENTAKGLQATEKYISLDFRTKALFENITETISTKLCVSFKSVLR